MCVCMYKCFDSRNITIFVQWKCFFHSIIEFSCKYIYLNVGIYFIVYLN